MRTDLNHPPVPALTPLPPARQVISGPTMGTRYSAVFYAAEAGDLSALRQALQAAVDVVDAQMSTWKPDSDLMRLNRAPPEAWFDLPEHLCTVLAAALEIGRQSEGAFDIGVGDLVSAWGFGSSGNLDAARITAATGAPRLPAHLCLDLDREQHRVCKHTKITLDLSGIAKGYGVDQLTEVLTSHGIGHFLVSIDGELRASGRKPDGSPWRVAVEAPEAGRRQAGGVIELTDGAVATSGDYRHFVDIGGTRYAHTMDPRTRAPLAHAPAAVTVMADTCMAADAWATALLVLGATTGGNIAARHGLEALFIERPRVSASATANLPRSTKED
jgi:FAD:protein FMN transferase